MRLSAAILLLGVISLSGSLSGQWRGGGGGGRPHWGTSQPSGGAAFAHFAYPIQPLYREPVYYGGSYGYGLPFTQVLNPYPTSGNGGPTVIVIQAAPPQPQPAAETRVVYIPSYFRPNPGPSLAEQAKAAQAERQPAKYKIEGTELKVVRP